MTHFWHSSRKTAFCYKLIVGPINICQPFPKVTKNIILWNNKIIIDDHIIFHIIICFVLVQFTFISHTTHFVNISNINLVKHVKLMSLNDKPYFPSPGRPRTASPRSPRWGSSWRGRSCPRTWGGGGWWPWRPSPRGSRRASRWTSYTVSGVWSFGGCTKIGRMKRLPVNREYQYFLTLGDD